jgi:hypothetical protein
MVITMMIAVIDYLVKHCSLAVCGVIEIVPTFEIHIFVCFQVLLEIRV